MQICKYNGFVISVLTRNEHCPPHVHAGTDRWEARLLFSFWHNGVRLWDVTPSRNEPQRAMLEALRLELRKDENLHRARECWWLSRQSLCLENQQWDLDQQEVVAPGYKRPRAHRITASRYDGQRRRTILQLAGQAELLEIEL